MAIYKIANYIQDVWPAACEFSYGLVPYFILKGMDETNTLEMIKPHVHDIIKSCEADLKVTVTHEKGKQEGGIIYVDNSQLTWNIIFPEIKEVPPEIPMDWLIEYLQNQLYYTVLKPGDV
jgi:hypothetical protein